jgi:aerobic-type carbon monoxide dehydrogenase small subunit (CoxS/CutS family)
LEETRGKALLNENPRPTVGEIKTAIAGNICRCTGYTKIIRAIRTAAERTSGRMGASRSGKRCKVISQPK